MAIQPIDVGSGPGAGNGENLYSAFTKINSNTTELDQNNAAALTAAQTAADLAALADGKATAALNAASGAVSSVAGKVGIVTLDKTDVGLGNVNNISDALKPVSADQAAAIALGDGLRLKTSDVYNDFIASGLTIAVPLNSNVTDVVAGVAYANSTRFSVAAALARPFVVSRDTYVEVTGTGTLNYHEKANGVAPDAVPAGSLRFAKVVTDTTKIISVTQMAPRVTKGNIVTSSTDANNNTVLVVDGINYATLPIDPITGNVSAQVNHRTGLLGNASTGLLSLSGGLGEIGVATDSNALVKYTGVAGEAKAFWRSHVGPSAAFRQATNQNITGGAAPVTLNLDAVYVDSAITFDAALDTFRIPAGSTGLGIDIALGVLPSAGRWLVELEVEPVPDFWISLPTFKRSLPFVEVGSAFSYSVKLFEPLNGTGVTGKFRIRLSHNVGTSVITPNAAVLVTSYIP